MDFGSMIPVERVLNFWSRAGKWLKGLFKKTPCPTRQVDLTLDKHAARSLMKRGWTEAQIQEAVEKGKAYPAVDKTAGGAPATRYIHPTTGKSVVVNNETGKVIHLGGEGFKYE